MSKYPVTVQHDKATRLPLLFSTNIRIGHIELILKG